MSQLEFTGERLIPGVFGKVAAEHLHRYAFTFNFVRGKKVLDIASGEGYGSNLIAKYAREVIGIDISKEAVGHAKEKYVKSNLAFDVGSVLDIPCESGIFDVVVSFETIEHISDHKKMISEVKRVLKTNGVLIISTPEKSVYSDKTKYTNPYHEMELYEQEFLVLISDHFKYFSMGNQKFLSGSFIHFNDYPIESLDFYFGNFSEISKKKNLKKEYLVSICSNVVLDLQPKTTFFEIGEWEKYLTDEYVNYQLSKIKKSLRYRIGDFFLRPFDILKKAFK